MLRTVIFTVVNKFDFHRFNVPFSTVFSMIWNAWYEYDLNLQEYAVIVNYLMNKLNPLNHNLSIISYLIPQLRLNSTSQSGSSLLPNNNNYTTR